MKKSAWLGLAGFAVALNVGMPAHAAVLTVTTTADTYADGDGVCSLREAVDISNYDECLDDCGCAAWEGLDEIVLSAGSTYTVTSPIYISDSTIVRGNSAIVRASGAMAFNGIIVQPAPRVEVNDLVLEGFRRAAFVVDQNASAVARRLEVRNNFFSVGNGQNGSVWVVGGGYLHLIDANIHHNVSSIKGGGIYIGAASRVDLERSRIHDNQVSQYGGGVYNQGRLYCFGGSSIDHNQAVYGGGGIFRTSTGTLTLAPNGCQVSSNTSTMGGANIGS